MISQKLLAGFGLVIVLSGCAKRKEKPGLRITLEAGEGDRVELIVGDRRIPGRVLELYRDSKDHYSSEVTGTLGTSYIVSRNDPPDTVSVCFSSLDRETKFLVNGQAMSVKIRKHMGSSVSGTEEIFLIPFGPSSGERAVGAAMEKCR